MVHGKRLFNKKNYRVHNSHYVGVLMYVVANKNYGLSIQLADPMVTAM